MEADQEVSITIPTDNWLASIMESSDADHLGSFPKIQKVPHILRKIKSNESCYTPSIVSIGPYHHGREELHAVEMLKPQMARQFSIDCRTHISHMYNKVGDKACDARNCNAEGSTDEIDDEAFAKMMFLDGCFVLHFVDCKLNWHKRENIKMKRHMLAYAQRDLFLFENQVPFLVLDALMSFMTFKEDEGGMLMLRTFTQQSLAIPRFTQQTLAIPRDFSVENEPPRQQRLVHLLDLLHEELIDERSIPCIQVMRSIEWYSYRSANKLMTTGIHFKPSKTSHFTDVTFEGRLMSGTLRLPPMSIDSSTKSILLNLLAYEKCPGVSDNVAVTSAYICFMDSLIDDVDDVRELRSKGILLNFMGDDQQVAELFHELATDLVPTYSYDI